MERYLRLTRMPATDYFDYVATRLVKSASSWMNSRLLAIEKGDLANWTSWDDLKADMIASFEPVTSEEQARKQLRSLTQTGRVSGYVTRFRELQYKLPEMTRGEAFSAFLAGLQPQVRQHVGAHVRDDLEEAITMALRLDLFRATDGEKGKGKERLGHPKPKKTGVHNIETTTADGSSGGQVNAVDQKTKKTRRGRRQNRGGQSGGGRGDRPAPKCFCCGGDHLMKNCPEWKEMREKMRTSSQGNA